MGKSKPILPLNTILIILTGTLLFLVSFFIYQNSLLTQKLNLLTTNQTPQITPTPTQNLSQTQTWKTYSNTKFNIKFKYPEGTNTKITNKPNGLDYLVIDTGLTFSINSQSIKDCTGVCPNLAYSDLVSFNDINFEKTSNFPFNNPKFIQKGEFPNLINWETKLSNKYYALFQIYDKDQNSDNFKNKLALVSQILDTYKKSCQPRPACLDSYPACKIVETPDMCPKVMP